MTKPTAGEGALVKAVEAAITNPTDARAAVRAVAEWIEDSPVLRGRRDGFRNVAYVLRQELMQ